MNNKGSVSVESAVVMPLALLIMIGLTVFNIYFFNAVYSFSKEKQDEKPRYCDTHRAISAVFDAGGDIYEALFGGEETD